MPPTGPLLKDDGPACRVCGCTEHNACPVDTEHPDKPHFPGGPFGCSWIAVPDSPRYLCSACAGTLQDASEVIARVLPLRRKHTALQALGVRIKKRLQA